MPFGVNPTTGKPGPAPKPGRSGDKKQARARVNRAVNRGDLVPPNDLPCVDCGHRHLSAEDRRHEYDHHHGYDAAHHLDVVVRCADCHHQKDDSRASKSHCVHGHAFNGANTIIAKNGTRHCRECRRAHDRKRGRRAEYWRAYRRKKKGEARG